MMGRQSTTSSFRFFSLSAGNANEWEERMDQMTRQELLVDLRTAISKVRFDIGIFLYVDSIYKHL